jgi:hypothetical protein
MGNGELHCTAALMNTTDLLLTDRQLKEHLSMQGQYSSMVASRKWLGEKHLHVNSTPNVKYSYF